MNKQAQTISLFLQAGIVDTKELLLRNEKFLSSYQELLLKNEELLSQNDKERVLQNKECLLRTKEFLLREVELLLRNKELFLSIIDGKSSGNEIVLHAASIDKGFASCTLLQQNLMPLPMNVGGGEGNQPIS